MFGANDGLVRNLALIMGISARGADNNVVLLSGIAGLLAGALSMGAGEFVSVRSQRELLEASTPNPQTQNALQYLEVDANELALVYRARGMPAEEAHAHAVEVLETLDEPAFNEQATHNIDEHETIGTGLGAGTSSFCFFSCGAILPVLPYFFGLHGLTAIIVAAVIVGLALLGTGAVVGLISGGPPLKRALRQLAIGYGAAAATYLLGLALGTGDI